MTLYDTGDQNIGITDDLIRFFQAGVNLTAYFC